jgi:hypothetical protein
MGASNEVFTLGNHLSELATHHGARSLHLHVVLSWEDLPKGFLAPFATHVPANTNVVFDLRPLQSWAALRAFRNLDPELRRVLVGADMLVILAGD